MSFNVHNDIINCNNKTTFHEIFSKNLERIVSVKFHFSILEMLVRKSPRFKKKNNYSEVTDKIQWKIVAIELSKRIDTALPVPL